jgi:flagellar protein FliS
MAHSKNPWQSYRKVATQTAPPAQLVLMLYDGAISFLEKGTVGFTLADPLERNRTISNNVLRAQAIIHELNARLDMRNGLEAASNFRRLYNYFHRRLQEGNIRKKKEPIAEVILHLSGLRDSWAEMLRRGTGNDLVPASNQAQSRLQAA